jgi:hypothetical protein
MPKTELSLVDLRSDTVTQPTTAMRCHVGGTFG